MLISRLCNHPWTGLEQHFCETDSLYHTHLWPSLLVYFPEMYSDTMTPTTVQTLHGNTAEEQTDGSETKLVICVEFSFYLVTSKPAEGLERSRESVMATHLCKSPYCLTLCCLLISSVVLGCWG